MTIEPLPEALYDAAIRLWHDSGLTRPWNDPAADLRRAASGSASAVLAAVGGDGCLLATAMVGHDGHRGWVYYLAVDAAARGRGLGRRMMEACETWVHSRGVPKIQLMVRSTNQAVVGFYEHLGYVEADVVTLGLRLDGQTARGWLSGPGGDAEGALTMVGGARTVPVLITGCSSGIGRAAAVGLHAAGLTVYATARRLDALAGLARQGIHTLALDVTDEASMTAAVAAVEEAAGPVGVLVNNAGYGLYGPVEQLPMDEIRRQFETNFFGLVRLTQLVLPGMRRRGRGRILNVSSMGGRITLPGGAFYHASKYAVEALSDALRIEVAQFGIDVVLIEPGPVKTPWNDVAAASLSTATLAGSGPGGESPGGGDPYATYKAAVGASFGRTQAGLVGRFGSTSEDIAKVITQAVTARRPRARYLINPVAKSLVVMNQVLPARAYDSMLRRQYGLPR